MATTLPSIVMGAPGSPRLGGAGSPGLATGRKMTRKDARAEFKKEVAKIVEGVELTKTFADTVCSLKRTEKVPVAFVDAQGTARQFLIGRTEYNEFLKQLSSQLKKLPTTANNLFKSHREVKEGTGFLAPARFGNEIVQFFSQAELGPQVRGSFVMKKDTKTGKMKSVPDNKSLIVQPNTRLNDALYFVRQQGNPLYGITNSGTLTPLFALHAYYRRMAYPHEATRLSASDQMRAVLGPVMRKTIEADREYLLGVYASNTANAAVNESNARVRAQIDQVSQALINSISSPNPLTNPQFAGILADPNFKNNEAANLQALGIVNSRIGDEEIFNPNFFLYAHFSKLISQGKLMHLTPQGKQESLSAEEINQLAPSVYGVFRNQPELNALFGAEPATAQTRAINIVLRGEQDQVALARAHKNKLQAASNKARKQQEKQLAAQQQLQQLPAPLLLQQ